jgi:hypothetical protein
MNYHKTRHLPAPCIIDTGMIVNKDDIKRLLNDLNCVRYIHTLDGQVQSEGEGWVLEVFSDPNQATLVANNSLYLNLQSFDYLYLSKSAEKQTYYDLIQDNRQLRLIPMSSNSLQEQNSNQKLDEAALEEMLNQVLAAKWDVQLDDDEGFY